MKTRLLELLVEAVCACLFFNTSTSIPLKVGGGLIVRAFTASEQRFYSETAMG